MLIDRAKGLCLNDTQEGTGVLPLTLLVQLVERRFPKPDVVGSSPTGRVFSIFVSVVKGDK